MDISNYKWLQWLLGFDASSIPESADARLDFTYLPQSWGVFVLIGIVLLGVYLVAAVYRREIDTCPRGVKHLLAGLRVASLLVLLAVFLGPALTYTLRRTLQPLVVVLRDESASMATSDAYPDESHAKMAADVLGVPAAEIPDLKPTRAELVNQLFERDGRKLLADLQGRGKVRVIDFSNRLERVDERLARPAKSAGAAELDADETEAATDADGKPNQGVKPLAKLDPVGQGTDLYRAVRESIADKMTAAVVIFTDGQHTADGDLAEAAQAAKEKGVPLLVVGVGDPSNPPNIRISELYANPLAWKDDDFSIDFAVRSKKIGRKTVQVSLVEVTESETAGQPATENVVDRQDVELPPEDGIVRGKFTLLLREPGRRAYTVRVEQLPGESDLEDNEAPNPVQVKVLDKQARVLLVAGAPSWEYRNVQRLLTREDSVDLSCWLQTLDDGRAQEGDTPIRLLPAAREDLFAYDVILLFDPDPKEFDKAWIDLVKEFVAEHGGGFLYMAGPKFAGEFLAGNRTGSLRDVLPVRFGDVQYMTAQTWLTETHHSYPLSVVAANVDLPLMRFYSEPEKTLARWQTLPGVYWTFPSQEAKPASKVLIEHGDPSLTRPLLVAGQYGFGHTVFMGFNGTWRWRRVGHNAEFFNDFWINTVRHLIEGRSMEGRRRGTIETKRYAYQLGDRVSIEAELKDSSYQPIALPEVTATLRIAGGESRPVVLKAVPNQPGKYEATITARNTGPHTLTVEPYEETIEPPRIEVDFSVSEPTVEKNEVWLNKTQLTTLADNSGGRYFEVNETAALAAAIPDRSRTIDMRSKPVPVWDTNRVLILLVVLLSIEWAVRKAYKLL